MFEPETDLYLEIERIIHDCGQVTLQEYVFYVSQQRARDSIDIVWL